MLIRKLNEVSLSGITRNKAVFFLGFPSTPRPRLLMSISSSEKIRFTLDTSHKRSMAFTMMMMLRTVSVAPSFNLRYSRTGGYSSPFILASRSISTCSCVVSPSSDSWLSMLTSFRMLFIVPSRCCSFACSHSW